MNNSRRACIGPEHVVIFGIKPKDLDYGLDLSPEIAALIPQIIDMVLAELPPADIPGV